jgi:hypothetical protein
MKIRVQSTLGLKEKDYIFARSCLIHKNFIDYDGTLFQVLSLPVNQGGAANVK